MKRAPRPATSRASLGTSAHQARDTLACPRHARNPTPVGLHGELLTTARPHSTRRTPVILWFQYCVLRIQQLDNSCGCFAPGRTASVLPWPHSVTNHPFLPSTRTARPSSCHFQYATSCYQHCVWGPCLRARAFVLVCECARASSESSLLAVRVPKARVHECSAPALCLCEQHSAYRSR